MREICLESYLCPRCCSEIRARSRVDSPARKASAKKASNVHHALLDQDDQLVVRNGRKVAAEINLYHAPGSPIQVVANRRRGHLRVSLRSVAVRTWVKVGLEDRFQHQLHRSLHHAILNRRDPQWPSASLRFRDIHSSHRLKAIALGAQLFLQSAEHSLFFSTRLNAFDGFVIHARRTPIGFYLSPCLPEHVHAPHFVVQTVELHSFRLLGVRYRVRCSWRTCSVSFLAIRQSKLPQLH